MFTSFVHGCYVSGTTTGMGSPLGVTSCRGTNVLLMHYPIFGNMLLSSNVLTFRVSYTKIVVLVQRGQRMSIGIVLSRVGVFRTWVSILTMPLPSAFKLGPFAFVFGMPCKEQKLFLGLIICVDITSHPWLEMITCLLTV